MKKAPVQKGSKKQRDDQWLKSSYISAKIKSNEEYTNNKENNMNLNGTITPNSKTLLSKLSLLKFN